jgi:hypothetical protein
VHGGRSYVRTCGSAARQQQQQSQRSELDPAGGMAGSLPWQIELF